MIRIRGRGVDPSNNESSTDESFLENTTMVLNSEQQYALSQDRVNLGPVPLGSPVRRIIFLENRSTKNSALFQWKLCDDRFLSVRPQSGQIEPGGQQMVRIEYFVGVERYFSFCRMVFNIAQKSMLTLSRYRCHFPTYSTQNSKKRQTNDK